MDHFVAHKFIWMSSLSLKLWIKCKAMTGICIYWSCRCKRWIILRMFGLMRKSLSSFKERDLKSVTSLMKPSTQWEVQAHHELAIDLVGTLWSDVKNLITHVLIMGWACSCLLNDGNQYNHKNIMSPCVNSNEWVNRTRLCLMWITTTYRY